MERLKHEGLIHNIAEKYRRMLEMHCSESIEDLKQEARITVFKCLKKFDSSLGYSVSTYLSKCINTTAIDYLRSRSIIKKPYCKSGLKLYDCYVHVYEYDPKTHERYDHASAELELEGAQEAYRKALEYCGKYPHSRWCKTTMPDELSKYLGYEKRKPGRPKG